VWANSFVILSSHLLPPSYCQLLYHCTLHLGCWARCSQSDDAHKSVGRGRGRERGGEGVEKMGGVEESKGCVEGGKKGVEGGKKGVEGDEGV